MFTKQQRQSIISWCSGCLLVAAVAPVLVHADLPLRYSNENFALVAHERPVQFRQDGYGGFVGYTETGRVFRQFPIAQSATGSLHRFEIDTAFFYISDQGVFTAANDLVALSMYYATHS